MEREKKKQNTILIIESDDFLRHILRDFSEKLGLRVVHDAQLSRGMQRSQGKHIVAIILGASATGQLSEGRAKGYIRNHFRDTKPPVIFIRERGPFPSYEQLSIKKLMRELSTQLSKNGLRKRTA